MGNILLFAGTTEGRKIADYLRGSATQVYACVATEYGRELLAEGANIRVLAGRLDASEMKGVVGRYQIETVIDATHPFAKEVTKNVVDLCKTEKLRYFRVLREKNERQSGVVYMADIQTAADFLKETKGNILIATGSKELAPFTEIPGYKERCFVRALSTQEAVETCIRHGFEGKHLIAMQGPYSMDMNVALLQHTGARYMVTKESGRFGGLEEKLRAAEQTGTIPVVIGRPEEEGYELSELFTILQEEYHIKRQPRISLVGIGPGQEDQMTGRGKELIADAEAVIGAKRMLLSVSTGSAVQYEEYRPEQIRDYLKAHPEFTRIVVVLSGDVSFYSGAKRLAEVLKEYEVSLVPGVSSVAYLAARLQIPLEETALCSLHGRQCHVVDKLREHGAAFVLVSNGDEIQGLCRDLCEYGYGDASVSVGSRLSYEDERITSGLAAEMVQNQYEPLSVVYVCITEHIPQKVTQGLPDELFIRGKVPMTKSEVRSIILSKLRLSRDSVIYDIGAGTGSVAIEMAMCAADGMVYAVEQNPEGIQLIKENQRKLHVSNVQPISGRAPEVLAQLPAPTHVFIGGSSGNLPAILDAVKQKNEQVQIVLSAITLNTVSECMQYLQDHKEMQAEIIQVQISHGKQVGAYHMMTGNNPIYIFKF